VSLVWHVDSGSGGEVPSGAGWSHQFSVTFLLFPIFLSFCFFFSFQTADSNIDSLVDAGALCMSFLEISSCSYLFLFPKNDC
jgi:hypothetical protein